MLYNLVHLYLKYIFVGIDTRLRFNLEPPPGDSAFDQWKDAMKAVARLPLGIPDGFRKKVGIQFCFSEVTPSKKCCQVYILTWCSRKNLKNLFLISLYFIIL